MRRYSLSLAPAIASILLVASFKPTAADEVLAFSELDDYLGDMPVVLSASRLSQPINESPASITVIDRALIEVSGARSIADLFRLVPGFQVGEPRAGSQVVTYHGFGDEFQRRLQVLIDGRSVYIPLYGGVPWASLPLTLEDIERIEVVRGPNAAVFGPNAFSAVINITTRHAAEDFGLYASAERGGEEGEFGRFDRVVVRGAYHEGDLDMRMTLEGRDDNGYDNLDDSAQLSLLTSRIDYSASAIDQISVQFGISDGDYIVGEEGDIFDPLRARGVENYFAQARWERDFSPDDNLSIQLYHNVAKWKDQFHSEVDGLAVVMRIIDVTFDRARSISSGSVHDLLTQADAAFGNAQSADDLIAVFGLIQQAAAQNTNPDVAAWIAEVVHYLQQLPGLLAQSGSDRQASFDFDSNAVSERTEVEVQRARRLNDELRVVYGGSIRRDRVEAPGYMVDRSPKTNDVFRLFSHAEWQFADNFMLNAGAMIEDNEVTGTDTSPRIALLYRQSPRSVWRMGFSRATRTPVLFERHANMRIDFDIPSSITPFDGEDGLSLFEIVALGDLEPETIEAWEIGYNRQVPEHRARFDLKLYHEEIKDLIDTTRNPLVLEDNDFNDTTTAYANRRGANIAGLEIETSIDPRPDTTLRLGYGYANVWNAERDADSVPKRTLSLMLIHRLSPADTLSAEYYYVDDMTWMDTHDNVPIRRLDLRASHRFSLNGADASFSVQLENLLDEYSNYFTENERKPALFVRLALEAF